MPTELERNRVQLADAVWRTVSAGKNVTEPMRVASESLEEIIGYRGAFDPVNLPSGVTVSLKQLPENDDVTAIISYRGVERDHVTVDRPYGGPGVLGTARLHATEARHHRWVADCLKAASKSESLISQALQEAEKEEAALREIVIGNPSEFNRHALAAQRVRAWLAGPKDDVEELIKALVTKPLPHSPDDVSRARKAMKGAGTQHRQIDPTPAAER